MLAGVSLAAHGWMAIATQDWMAQLQEPPVNDQPIPIEWVELPPAALPAGSESDVAAEDSPSSSSETLATAPTASPRSSSSSESSIAVSPLQARTPPEAPAEIIENEPAAPPNSLPPPGADVESDTGLTDSTDIATNSDGISGGEGDGLQQIRDGDAPPLPGNLGALADNSGVPVDPIDPSNRQTIPTEPTPTEFQIALWIEPLPPDQAEPEDTSINSVQFKAVDEQAVPALLTQLKQDQPQQSPDQSSEEAPELPTQMDDPASSDPEPSPSIPDPSAEEPLSPEPLPPDPTSPNNPQPQIPAPEPPSNEPALLPEPLDFERSFMADPTQSECDAVSDVDANLGDRESFSVIVDEDGEVVSIEPQEENFSDYQAFAQCLIQEWPFEPATLNGEAVESDTFLAHITITVEPPAQ